MTNWQLTRLEIASHLQSDWTGVDWYPSIQLKQGLAISKSGPSQLEAEAKSVVSGTLATGRFGNSGCLDDSLTITRDHNSNMKEESV